MRTRFSPFKYCALANQRPFLAGKRDSRRNSTTGVSEMS